MGDEEAEELIDRINRTPDYQRKRDKYEMGRVWGLTYEERQKWKIRTVRPCDLTEEEFLERCKARKQYVRYLRRRKAGQQTRAEWLASRTASRRQPWKEEGIGRSTWYRRLKQASETTQSSGTGVVPIKLVKGGALPVSRSMLRGESGTCAVADGDKKGSKRSNGRKIA
jgi:hypothetical protein